MPDERSRAGVPIHRHVQSREGGFSSGNPRIIDAVTAHVTRHIGEPSEVFHELVSPHVHIDVHIVAPSEERPAWTLVTSGMSERPMADGSFAS